MRNRLLTILSLFLFSISLLSCATSNLDFQRDARDTFVKIKQNVAITVCNPADPKECLTKAIAHLEFELEKLEKWNS